MNASRAWLTGALLTGTLLVASSSAALAQAPAEQGWWTSSTPDVATALPVPFPTPADVPADGLLVQGGADGPQAYAAVVYDIEPSTGVRRLVLHVDGNSASAPGSALKLCRLRVASITQDHGGPMAHAPAYDCATSVRAVAGSSQAGASYTFDPARLLVGTRTLAVAILPVSATDRVVLSKVGADSLVTTRTPGERRTSPLSTPVASIPAEGSAPESHSVISVAPLGPRRAPDQPDVAPLMQSNQVLESAPGALPGDGHRTPQPRGLVLLAVALIVAATLWRIAGQGEAAAD